ncbi:MAG: extracellular solute-binding protein [Anaerolineae bacterium]
MVRKFGLLSVLLLVLIGMALPTAAQDDPYADVDPSGQTIVFWHQHSGAREEELMRIIETFNETNEFGITVEAINQGGYDEIFERVTTNIAAGDQEALPELVVAYGNQSATYDLVGDLVDISLFVESPTWGLSEEELNDFFASFLAADVIATSNNELLGFPPNRSMEVMYYNADWLAELSEAGAISFDGPPTTPEQFREAACAATANAFSGATTDTAPIGYQLSYDASRLASWTFAFGGDIFDYEAGEYNFDGEATVEAMTFLRDLGVEGCAGEIFERFGDQANFGNGATLFTVGSSSGLPFYATAVESGANFDWSVAAVPYVTEEPVMNIYGASVSIPASTPEAELAAWIFMQYYTTPEVQNDWARASNYFPVRASVAENLEDYFAENAAYGTAFELLQFGATEPQVPGYDPVRAAAAETMAAIFTGLDDRPVEEVLAELNEFANEELELAMEAVEN